MSSWEVRIVKIENPIKKKRKQSKWCKGAKHRKLERKKKK
jgi:hypothetical protein